MGPAVIPELSTKGVLTSEFVKGIPIDKLADPQMAMDQEERNQLAQRIVELCLRELFEYRFMQTDPNWSNFLYDPEERVLNLIDFGACRGFSKTFTDGYLKMVQACASRDRAGVIQQGI